MLPLTFVSMQKLRAILLLPLIAAIETAGNDFENLSFPNDFKFGLATASYQVEGGWNASGKGENIWDRLTHVHSTRIKDHSNGNVACDSYHLWKEDVSLLKDIGAQFYRFSISWSRVLPTGYANVVNPDGIRYYNNLINELLAQGVEPMATIYHWDLPQPLEELGGWPNEILVQHFVNYADVVFKLFGDRVKHWITFNEPIEVCESGYGDGTSAPGKMLSGLADYLCGRTLLLAHAQTYHLYNKKYRPQQNGSIGITVNTIWAEPKTNSLKDQEAAERVMQMQFGWWEHPIFSSKGDYPQVMIDRISNISRMERYASSRLPKFSAEEVSLIRGTADFLGLNHYTSRLASDMNISPDQPTSFFKDIGALLEYDPFWEKSAASWLISVPWGLRKVLNWIKKEYDNPVVYITENGFADLGQIDDIGRINYYREYLDNVLKAIWNDGCNVKRYTAWSLIDNMEWLDGYTLKFGLYYVNFTDPNRSRRAKSSTKFFKQLIETGQIPKDVEPSVSLI